MDTNPSVRLPRVTGMAHSLLRDRLRPGDRAVDATVGNGHDTLFLADCVGENGEVIGFDIQSDAIRSARERLGGRSNVVLHELGHEHLASHVGSPLHAITFNLGYLPGSDKSIITRPDTTLVALEAALEHLDPRGIITIVAYPGHAGGDEEANLVLDWVQQLDPDSYLAVLYQIENRRETAPFLVAIERKAD